MKKTIQNVSSSVTRRKFITASAGILAAPAILNVTKAYADNPTLKIGHVSPRTGPLAGFAEADDYVLEAITKTFAAGLQNNGKT